MNALFALNAARGARAAELVHGLLADPPLHVVLIQHNLYLLQSTLLEFSGCAHGALGSERHEEFFEAVGG